MIKTKFLSGVISAAVFSSMSLANAGDQVVGQLVANPTAIINASSAKLKVGAQPTSYIEGDTITTGSDASATIYLSSGGVKLTIAPNSLAAVSDALNGQFIMFQGALSIDAKKGQEISIKTPTGTFELAADRVNAIISYENGEFAAITKGGSLTITSQGGVVSSIDTGTAFVYNDAGAKSLDVQTNDIAKPTGYSTLDKALFIGGVGAVALLAAGGGSSGGGDDDDDAIIPTVTPAASPAE